MEEQEKQNFENQESQSQSVEVDDVKNTPRKTFIIGALVLGTVIIPIIVLIAALAGQNKDDGNIMYSCTHSYISEPFLEATCTRGQSMQYTCSICGDSYINWDELPALGHDWKSATCTEAERCSRCYVKKDPNSEPLGHAWTEPTCTENRKCSACGIVTYSSLLGHDFSEINGLCTRCDFGVEFILPTTPIIIKKPANMNKRAKSKVLKLKEYK